MRCGLSVSPSLRRQRQGNPKQADQVDQVDNLFNKWDGEQSRNKTQCQLWEYTHTDTHAQIIIKGIQSLHCPTSASLANKDHGSWVKASQHQASPWDLNVCFSLKRAVLTFTIPVQSNACSDSQQQISHTAPLVSWAFIRQKIKIVTPLAGKDRQQRAGKGRNQSLEVPHQSVTQKDNTRKQILKNPLKSFFSQPSLNTS